MPICLRARWVFPVDRPPIEGGVVTIDGERIVDVSDRAPHGQTVDLGDAVLLPGFVNAHTHLEFSYLQQPLGKPGMSLVEWIRLVIAERGKSRPSASQSNLQGWSEATLSGATTIADIVTEKPGILFDRIAFHEVIGFSRARAESAMNALAERIGFEGAERLISKIEMGISPHAPYTVSQSLLCDLVSLARQHDLPMAMHIAESREELELLHDGTGPFKELLEERSMWDSEAISHGSRPIDYLRTLNNAPRALVVHGNYLNEEELAFLATNRERLTLVYCPRTHAYFCHPMYPLAQAIAMGVRLVLGTDSRASNPELNFLSEMRFVAQTHRTVSPDSILRMGTLLGAEALGIEKNVGSLTPGKLANIVAVLLVESAVGSAAQALEGVLYGEQNPTQIWIRGRELISDSRQQTRG